MSENINQSKMRILDETDELLVGHIYEDAYLIGKKNGEELMYDTFWGDPSCGLISKNNDWAIIAGDHLTIWINGQMNRINDLDNIEDLRVINNHSVEILTDPWSNNSAIWQLELFSLKLTKVRDFRDYIDREYTDVIKW